MGEENSTEFESRDYQVELFELATKNNIILYLPTGSGKTFIATLLIKHYWKNTALKTIEDGGKRTFFLVNTVSLVEQQANQILAQTVFNVGKYSGDMGVDFWDKSVWLDEINNKHVLIMTTQIFVDLLQNNIMSLKSVNLLIFDECHRAVSNHPMRQVMMNFKYVNEADQPRVLGLTATLLNANVKACNVESEIKNLECTFMAKIATSVNEEMVAMYSTNPDESKVKYKPNDTSGKMYQIVETISKELKECIKVLQIEEPVLPPVGSNPHQSKLMIPKDKIGSRIVNLIEDTIVNMNDLGVFGGRLSILAHIVQVTLLIPNCQLDVTKSVYQAIICSLLHLRCKLELEMNKFHLPASKALHYFSSDKVNKLLLILKKVKPEDSAIVFCKRRFTAKVLYYLLKEASKTDPGLNHVRSNFIVGFNIGNPFKDTRENYLQKCHNKIVLNQFNQRELNVLISSNVIEEGTDISQCNFVIMFDEVMDFRSYIQSKGRARDRNSNYIMLVPEDDDKFENRYRGFLQTERILKQILYGGKSLKRKPPTEKEVNESLFSVVEGLEPYRPQGVDGPVVTSISSITLINRYCASLKRDKFTKVAPIWWLKKEESKSICFIMLPMESRLRGCIEGTPQPNQEDAKRSAALEACKLLYQNGELDNNLLPVGLNHLDMKRDIYTPNMDGSEDMEEKVGNGVFKVGTKKYKRSCEKEWAACLCECSPQPDKEAFLYVIDMVPLNSPPTSSHTLVVLHDILKHPFNFAILTSKKLPKLASFPLYMSTGELDATIGDALQITLSKNELMQISDFHAVIFEQVLKVVKKFMIRDFSNKENSYLIAPVVRDSSGKLTIDWNAVEESKKCFPSIETKPSNQERQQLKVTDENYLGKIVSPWYRTVPVQNYLVTKVCYDMTEDSMFPNSSFCTYRDYFKEKYKLESALPNQPLLEVRALSGRLNSTKPRALTKQLKWKTKDENEELDIWLVPEYCVVYPLSGRYWVKALLLPSALHRISQLCTTEELRCRIVHDTGIGVSHLPLEHNWDKLAQDSSLVNEDIVIDQQQALTPLHIFSKTCNSPKSDARKVWGEEEEPIDIERYMESATLFDLINYNLFINTPVHGSSKGSINNVTRRKMTSMDRRPIPKMVPAPPLNMIYRTTKGIGPQQVQLLQSLTAAACHDFINCERLETLGDSFLKFVISLALFEKQPDWPEGHLTYMKGKIVGNKNLFYCGAKKSLNSILEVQKFAPKEEWVAPGFCVERTIQMVLRTAKLDPSCLFTVDVPKIERAAGKLGEVTHSKFDDVLLNKSEDLLLPQSCNFINQQALTDKNVSDAVEAILGIYLKSCGLLGALGVLNWFQVTSPELASPDIFTRKPASQTKGKGDPNNHLIEPEYLEEILNYKFKDRNILLQALTHPSYTRNYITTCYQRLEFLGDALIDFLITIHIYEKCKSLTPGDLTDLRSALVNNVTLSCISVRNDIHKFLIHNSTLLSDCIMRFAKHQQDRNHIIDNDILFLFEENDVNISEAIDVPKALGDVIEALVGAIYLDSGKSLDVTWKIVYNLMKDEIEKFHKNVPKNHVRMLYESECTPNFKSKILDNKTVMVTVEIMHKGVIKHFEGFGDNKREAKKAAAKHALRAIRSPSNQ